MPVPNKGETVLLTGATGFIAGHTIFELLKNGYKVKGTVRKAEQGDKLQKIISNNDFSFVVVPDMQDADSLADALKGTTSVLHVASPMSATTGDAYEHYVTPALNGTLALLKAAAENGNIKRVIYMSSFATVQDQTVIDDKYRFHIVDENSWNSVAEELYTKEKDSIDATNAYIVSKYAAERAAWDYVNSNKVNFDLSVINPVMVLGLPIGFSSVDDISLSTTFITNRFLGTATPQSDFISLMCEGAYVDVKDVAYLTVKSLITPEAAGKRFLAVSSNSSLQSLLDIVQYPKHKDLLAKFSLLEKGKPFRGQPIARQFDILSVVRTLEWNPIPLEETIVSILEGIVKVST